MKNKKWVRIVCLLLAGVMVLSVISAIVLSMV